MNEWYCCIVAAAALCTSSNQFAAQQARSRLLLDELREKQRRLKAEYEAMEEQLVAMEAALGVQASNEARRPRKDLDIVEQDDAGNVTFRCGD